MAKGGSGFDKQGNGDGIWDIKERNGYKIDGSLVTTPRGTSLSVENYRELTPQEQSKYAQAIKKYGISDPVMANYNLKFMTPGILPKIVAETAISRGKAQKEAFARNVPGLQELRSAIDYDEKQVYLFRKSVEKGTGIMRGAPTSNTASAARKKYPIAAAYLTAEAYSNARHYAKSSFGKEAMNEIKKGKNAAAAIKKMKKKWGEYASKAID